MERRPIGCRCPKPMLTRRRFPAPLSLTARRRRRPRSSAGSTGIDESAALESMKTLRQTRIGSVADNAFDEMHVECPVLVDVARRRSGGCWGSQPTIRRNRRHHFAVVRLYPQLLKTGGPAGGGNPAAERAGKAHLGGGYRVAGITPCRFASRRRRCRDFRVAHARRRRRRVKAYFDASVLVGLFVNDPHTARAEAFLQSAAPVAVIGDFAAAEFASAIARRVRKGDLSIAEAQAVFPGFDLWLARTAERIETASPDVRLATAFLRRLDLTLRAPDALDIALAGPMRLSPRWTPKWPRAPRRSAHRSQPADDTRHRNLGTPKVGLEARVDPRYREQRLRWQRPKSSEGRLCSSSDRVQISP